MGQLSAVILAAGEGKRMHSKHAKVLHQVCGRPMVDWVLQAAQGAGADKRIVVVGHGRQELQAHLQDRVQYAVQEQQLGTGHAVLQAEELLHNQTGTVLVLVGDTPMLTAQTLQKAYAFHCNEQASATVLAATVEQPYGYGRVICRQGLVDKIVEEKDASEQERKVNLVNAGMYFFNCQDLFTALTQVGKANAQGEYYLTDVCAILKNMAKQVVCYKVENAEEIQGVNDRAQLAEAEKAMNRRTIARLQREGVTVIDPEHTYIEPNVKIGMDTVVYPGCYLIGATVIGEDCVIGPQTNLSNVVVGERVILKYTVGMDSEIGSDTTVGPFAYIRPNSKIGARVKIGDFVEIKNSTIDAGTKVSHLTYVGDSDVGAGVNFGCGTVTVNYDGTHKYRTTIGDKAFIGCNTNLVAPVTVAPEAFIAAGSTITEDIPDDCLAIARARQTNIKGWVSKRKEKNLK